MFDILPSSALPSEVELSLEMATLRDRTRKLFKELPAGAERDSVLHALGRVGRPSLRHKILHRAKFLLEKIPTQLPELSLVVDLAVDCRNHYVHGSEPKIEYSKNFFECVPFLTNALEFIFAASDLVQAGWEIDAWSRQGTTMSHPFARFVLNYDHGREGLKQLLAESV
ncbi:MAG: HEPN domain-containing protein [Parcubacteria group bacterium]